MHTKNLFSFHEIKLNLLSVSFVSSKRSLVAAVALRTASAKNGSLSLVETLCDGAGSCASGGANGSTRNNSSEPLNYQQAHSTRSILTYYKLTFITSLFEVASEKGAVGLATPKRTGAIRESAVSQSSSMDRRTKERKTLLHLLMGKFWLLKLEYNILFKKIVMSQFLETSQKKSALKLSTCH